MATSELATPRAEAARATPRDARGPIALIGGTVLLIAFAANDGGYFPTSWGWCALALLWASATVLLLSSRLEVGWLDVAFLVGLGAFVAWVSASVLWSASVTRSALESQRGLVYVAAVLAVVLLATWRGYRAWLTAVWLAITVITAFSLATRLFPERLGFFDPIAGYRLSEPIGYWNSLGLFAVMGALLAVGLVLTSVGAVRVLAGASLPILLATLYFTFGRSAWIVLGIGLVTSLLVAPARLRLATSSLALAAPVACVVWICSRADALTTQRASLEDASREGHRVALVVLLAVLVCGGLAFGLGVAGARLRLGGRLRVAWGGLLLALAAVAVVAVFIRFGSPPTLLSRAYDAFQASPPRVEGSLNERLFNLSGRGRADLWRVAWRDFEERPLLGTGAGTYERSWYEERPYLAKVRDAHSLYIETLAELGAIGLALLVFALSLPIVAALRARHRPLVPAAFGAYVAFLVHAGADWDWEIAAVTLAALASGAAVVVAARPESAKSLALPVRIGVVTVLVALIGWAGVGLMSNSALASGRSALSSGDVADASSDARTARRWTPWSAQPWVLLGRTQLAAGQVAAARRSFSEAVERDPEDWSNWYALARISSGDAQRRALTRARQLNPLGHRIAALRAETESRDAP